MKNIIKLMFLTVLLGSFGACKKDENRIYFEGGKPPVLTASVADNTAIPLSFATKDNEAIRFSWTNPDYMFTTGVSSQDVKYLLEMDTTGANFKNPNKVTIAISKDLGKTFSQSELNDNLLNVLLLVPGMQHNLEVRVVATIGNGSVPVTSNVMKFKVTPYAIPPKVVPPASGKLFITGSATPGNWQCACGEPELLTQKFNQVSPTLYELPSIYLNGGGSYLFIPVYASWGSKYGGVGGNNTNNVNGDDFKDGGSDLLAPAASGNYKIVVDFQRGKFTVTKL